MNQPPSRHWGAFWFGLVTGWAIGAVIGQLKAPRSGEQTRALIAQRGVALRSEAGRRAEEISLGIQERGRQIVGEMEADLVQQAIEEGKEVARRRQAALEGAPESPDAGGEPEAPAQ
jgi:gas vesicle protein